jgi:hypothetical protein
LEQAIAEAKNTLYSKNRIKSNNFFKYKYADFFFREIPKKPKLIKILAKVFGPKAGCFLLERYSNFRDWINGRKLKAVINE